MTEPLRLGIIGAGFNARFHLQSLVSVRDVVVAGVMNLQGQLASEVKNWPVIVFGTLFLLLEALMFVEAVRVLRSKRPDPLVTR